MIVAKVCQTSELVCIPEFCTTPYEAYGHIGLDLFQDVSCPAFGELKFRIAGKIIGAHEKFPKARGSFLLEPCISLLGGKGGFGSMLRAIGAQIEKTTNREACRDLSGRRLRDINEEKRVKDWISKQSERDREKKARRKAKLEKLCQETKHEFHDPVYDKQRADISDKVYEAMDQAKDSSSSAGPSGSLKRASDDEQVKPKKKKFLWTGVEEITDSESDSDSSDIESAKEIKSESESSDITSKAATGSADTELPEQIDQSKQDVGQLKLETAAPSLDELIPAIEVVETERVVSLVDREEGLVREVKDEPNHVDAEVVFDSKPTKFLPKLIPKTEAEIQSDATIISLEEPREVKVEDEPIIVEDYSSPESLEQLGLERLKSELQRRGLKCGGTLPERAARLFSVKGKSAEEIDPSLLAGSVGKKKKR